MGALCFSKFELHAPWQISGSFSLPECQTFTENLFSKSLCKNKGFKWLNTHKTRAQCINKSLSAPRRWEIIFWICGLVLNNVIWCMEMHPHRLQPESILLISSLLHHNPLSHLIILASLCNCLFKSEPVRAALNEADGLWSCFLNICIMP